MSYHFLLFSLQEVDTQLEEVVFDHLHSVAYQGTPLGMTILGPSKNVKYVNYYHSSSILLMKFTKPIVPNNDKLHSWKEVISY